MLEIKIRGLQNQGFSRISCLGNRTLPCSKLWFLCISLERIWWCSAFALLDTCGPWFRTPMVTLHVAGGEKTGPGSEWCHLSDKMFHSLAKLCQACCSSVSVVSNSFCVNGLCGAICLARREGDNPEELCVTGSADVPQLPCLALLQAGSARGWRWEQSLVCDSCRCWGLPSLVSVWDCFNVSSYPQLTGKTYRGWPGAGGRLRCAESVWPCGAEGALVLCVPVLLASHGWVDKTFCVPFVPLSLLCKTRLILDSASWSSNEKCSLTFT